MGTTASKGSREGFSAPTELTPTNMQERRKPHDVVQKTLADQKGSKPEKDAGEESGEKKHSSTTREKLRKLFGKRIGSRQEVGTTSTPDDLTTSTEDLSKQNFSKSVTASKGFAEIIESFEGKNNLNSRQKAAIEKLKEAIAPLQHIEKIQNRVQTIEEHIQSSTDKQPKGTEREN